MGRTIFRGITGVSLFFSFRQLKQLGHQVRYIYLSSERGMRRPGPSIMEFWIIVLGQVAQQPQIYNHIDSPRGMEDRN